MVCFTKKETTKGNPMSRETAIFISNPKNLVSAMDLIVGKEQIMSVKEQYGNTLAFSTLRAKGNDWEDLDFFNTSELLADFINDWVEGNWAVRDSNNTYLFNDEYLRQNHQFKYTHPHRAHMEYNRHILFRFQFVL